MTKSFLFLLFLFGFGYSAGPHFASAMKRDGPKPMLLAIVVSFTGLTAAKSGATGGTARAKSHIYIVVALRISGRSAPVS